MTYIPVVNTPKITTLNYERDKQFKNDTEINEIDKYVDTFTIIYINIRMFGDINFSYKCGK